MKKLIAVYVVCLIIIVIALSRITGFWIALGSVVYGTAFGAGLSYGGVSFGYSDDDDDRRRMTSLWLLTRRK